MTRRRHTAVLVLCSLLALCAAVTMAHATPQSGPDQENKAGALCPEPVDAIQSPQTLDEEPDLGPVALDTASLGDTSLVVDDCSSYSGPAYCECVCGGDPACWVKNGC